MTGWQHRDLASGRWHDMSLAEQFGNIGSEISRAIKWSARNPDTARSALYRALELIDLTLDDPRHRRSAPRLREIARSNSAKERSSRFLMLTISGKQNTCFSS